MRNFLFSNILQFIQGALPKTRIEKNELKTMIEKSLGLKGDELIEENYLQATKFINTSVGPTVVSHNLQAILNDKYCNNLTEKVCS